MKRAQLVWSSVVALAVGLALATPTRADDATIRALAGALSGIEQRPPPGYFRRGGDAMLADLVVLHDAPQTPRHLKVRTVWAAGHYSTPAARAFVVRVARTPGQDELLIREALLALGRAFGPSAITELTAWLSHASPIVRRGAIVALSRIDDPRARRALHDRLQVEPDVVVREAILRARVAQAR